jgi:6-phosphogluconate dehydrogenase
MDKGYDFGMIGLGVMGSNLLLNMADHGYKVVGYDKNPDKTRALESSAEKGTVVKGVNTLPEMISLLQKPRKIMMLVPAGNIVDSVITDLQPLVEAGDIIIDGGNSHYTDTLKRITALKENGLHFMGIGVSGGEQGARLGPSIMPGGDREAYKYVEPILKSIAAKVGSEPCVAYMGNDAAGHYVKMVHNGIEYAIMQLISESYDLLHNGLGMDNDELQKLFSSWNSGEMRSFLIEITASVLSKKDDDGKHIVDKILDKAGAKGTGKWTSEAALDLPVPVPTIDMAVMMRNISSLKEERKQAHKIYQPVLEKLGLEKELFKAQLHDALLFATILSYAQGLSMLAKASVALNMQTPLPDVIKVWRGGCIIRSALLDQFAKAFEKNKLLENLILDDEMAALLKKHHQSIATVVSTAMIKGYPVSALSASLNYFNAWCRDTLPTNLIQAQRDYFGSHTYERVDKEGIFHTDWEHDDKTVDHSSGH